MMSNAAEGSGKRADSLTLLNSCTIKSDVKSEREMNFCLYLPSLDIPS